MSLFGKKAMSLDEILKAVNALSDEDKAKLVAEMQGNKAEEEKPVEEVEEVAETTEEETQDETSEEAVEETPTEEGAEQPTEEVVEETTEEPAGEVIPEAESARDEMAQDNTQEIIKGLVDKVNDITEQLKGLVELKELMENFTQKQAESFGYKGEVLGTKKDYHDMSVEELKARQTKGI